MISAAEPRHQAAAGSPVSETPLSPVEEAFRREMGDRPSVTDSPRSPASTGFIEQLDLDFHEAEVHQDHEERS